MRAAAQPRLATVVTLASALAAGLGWGAHATAQTYRPAPSAPAPAPAPAPTAARPGAPEAAPAASAPAEGVRSTLLPIYLAAQDLLREKKPADARARLAELRAVPDLTPYETYQLQRLELSAAVGLDDAATADRLYAAVATSGRVSPAELLPLRFNVMVAAYRSNDHVRAAAVAAELEGKPGLSAEMAEQARQIRAQSLYLAKDYAAAAAALEAEIAALRAAGKVVSEQRLRMLASTYNQTKDRPRYDAVVEQLVQAYPKRDYWLDLLSATSNAPRFNDRWWLDLLRLKKAAAGLENGEDYFSAAEAAQQANLFVEARAWLAEGYQAGLLGKDAQAAAQAKLRDQVARQAAEDDAVINSPAGTAKLSREPVALVHWGMSYIAAGKPELGAPLLEEALTKPALKRPDEVRLRLATTYAALGQMDKARAHFQAIKDEEGGTQLARLWQLHLARPASK